MDERQRRVLAVVVAATVLCGGVLVELVGARAPSATNAINTAARERAAEDATPEDLGLDALAWEDTLIVDHDLDDGVRTYDYPVTVFAPPGTDPQSSTTCSEVGEDGSQTCVTITMGTNAWDDAAATPRAALVRVLPSEPRPAPPGATTGAPDEDTDR